MHLHDNFPLHEDLLIKCMARQTLVSGVCVCEVSLHVKIRGKGIVFIDEKPRSFLSACISRWLPNQRELLVRKKVRNEKQAKKRESLSLPVVRVCVCVCRGSASIRSVGRATTTSLMFRLPFQCVHKVQGELYETLFLYYYIIVTMYYYFPFFSFFFLFSLN